MSQQPINRREFVAWSSAVAASAAIASPTLGSGAQNSGANATTRAAHLARPKVAHLVSDRNIPGSARLASRTPLVVDGSDLPGPSGEPTLVVRPIPGLGDRISDGSSITVELFHPGAGLHSILYSAHAITEPGANIPAAPGAVRMGVPGGASATLRVTQTTPSGSQVTDITVPTAPGTHALLAIPTSADAPSPSWRFTSAQLDETGDIDSITNPLRSALRSCACLSVRVNA